MINPSFLKTLAKLNLPRDEYAIYGSGPLGIRDIRDSRDLDVVVTDSLYKKLKLELLEEEPGKLSAGEGVDIFSGELSKIKNFNEVIKRSEEIKGLKFVLLADIIEWKQARGREKDLRDIKLIEKYLSHHNKM